MTIYFEVRGASKIIYRDGSFHSLAWFTLVFLLVFITSFAQCAERESKGSVAPSAQGTANSPIQVLALPESLEVGLVENLHLSTMSDQFWISTFTLSMEVKNLSRKNQEFAMSS